MSPKIESLELDIHKLPVNNDQHYKYGVTVGPWMCTELTGNAFWDSCTRLKLIKSWSKFSMNSRSTGKTSVVQLDFESDDFAESLSTCGTEGEMSFPVMIAWSYGNQHHCWVYMNNDIAKYKAEDIIKCIYFGHGKQLTDKDLKPYLTPYKLMTP